MLFPALTSALKSCRQSLRSFGPLRAWQKTAVAISASVVLALLFAWAFGSISRLVGVPYREGDSFEQFLADYPTDDVNSSINLRIDPTVRFAVYREEGVVVLAKGHRPTGRSEMRWDIAGFEHPLTKRMLDAGEAFRRLESRKKKPA